MNELSKEMGFESAREMMKLVCEVDLTTPAKKERFLQWKDGDGTKDGLLKIIERNKYE
jgi:hypothetical protein